MITAEEQCARLEKEARDGDLKACVELMELGRRINDGKRMALAVQKWMGTASQGLSPEIPPLNRGYLLGDGCRWLEDNYDTRVLESIFCWLERLQGIDLNTSKKEPCARGSGDLAEIRVGAGYPRIQTDPREYLEDLLAIHSGVFRLLPNGRMLPGPEFPHLRVDPPKVPIWAGYNRTT